MASVLSESALEARRAYQREMYRKNPERQKAYTARYWERKARELEQQKQEQAQADGEASNGN